MKKVEKLTQAASRPTNVNCKVKWHQIINERLKTSSLHCGKT